MQKIDKSKILSTVYKKWEEALENNQEDHPQYESTHRFYTDVMMNLYHIQDGLCAYTEKKILASAYAHTEDNWTGGRYKSNKPKHFGELEHFDSDLKIKQAWLWDNLFMVMNKVNNEKRTSQTDPILKPDHPNYDPYELLDYDYDKHIFFANVKSGKLNQSEIDRINNMIDVLGLNFVKDWRKPYVSKRIKALESGVELDPIEEYITAFEITRRNLNL
ncbi:MAG: hypothetical protein U5N85_01055 [Arcicella sp.]|nr:hypothetical protein [Arcicella sp.]